MVRSLFAALFRATLHPEPCAKPCTLQNAPFLSYSPMYLWGAHGFRLCPGLPSPPGHLHTDTASPWTIYCSYIVCHSALCAFLIPRICVTFILFGWLITLGYWEFICLYLTLNCKFQGLLASSQALSQLCPMTHSQSNACLSLWPFSGSAFAPTSGHPYTFTFHHFIFNFSVFKGIALSPSIHDYFAKFYPIYRLPHWAMNCSGKY